MAARALDVDGARAGRRGLDAVAARARRRRIAAAGSPPWLHEEIARRLADRLGPMRSTPSRVLHWWPQVGGGEAALRERYPRAEIVGVETADDGAAAASAANPRGWLARLTRPRVPLVDDADDATLGRAGLVWANMVLSFVADPPALFARWHRLLDAEGLVVFSCPGPSTLRELRELYAELGWPAPTPAFIDMHDLGDMLVEAGFADPVLDQETLTLRWSSADALLAELRTLGGNSAPDRFVGLRTPAWKRRLVDALGGRARDGAIELSFEIAYGHGFKVAGRAGRGEPVAVSLDEMKAMVRRRSPR